MSKQTESHKFYETVRFETEQSFTSKHTLGVQIPVQYD